MSLQDIKCPMCGMNKFKLKVKMVVFKGKTEAENINASALTCSICGNIMFNANPPSKFKGTKSKDSKLTK